MGNKLVSIFQPKMEIQTKTIDSLPNEMLRAVLNKAEVKSLLVARGVSKRWLSVIEHVCEGKTSLVIMKNGSDISSLSAAFNGLVNFHQNSAIFMIESNILALSNDLANRLVKLFPRVEHLAIRASLGETVAAAEGLITLLSQWSSTISTLSIPFPSIPWSHRAELVEHIANLSALKRLNVSDGSRLKHTTLAQLEHYSHYDSDSVLAQLGPRCTSLILSNTYGWLDSRDITQILNVNTPLAKSLTHLKLKILGIENDDALSIICSNFVALQMMDISFLHYATFDAKLISTFGQLTKLAQLSISHLNIDLVVLSESVLSTLPSVRILQMTLCNFDHFDGDLFGRLFSVIFPRLEQITIHLFPANPIVRAALSQHLHRFVHLRKHSIVDCV